MLAFVLASVGFAFASGGGCAGGGGGGGSGGDASGGDASGGDASGGGAGEASGGSGGESAEGGAGGQPALGGSGGNASGGVGGSGGVASGGAPMGGASSGGAPQVRACAGKVIVGAGANPQVLRDDMSVRSLMTFAPDQAVRLERDPVAGKLIMMSDNGTIFRVDLNGATATRTMIYTATDIGMEAGSKVLGLSVAADGTFYVVSHMPMGLATWATESRATIWRGKPQGNARVWSKLGETDRYPRSNTYFDHEWSGITASPDGKFVFVNAGSRTDHGEVEDALGTYPGARESALTARILRFPADANALAIKADETFLTTNGYLFARGTRNSFDPEFSAAGELWAGDNGPDGDYHEELNHLQEGKHYGFPWRLGNEDNQMRSATYNPTADKRLDPGYGATRNGLWKNDPQFPAPPGGVTFVDPILNVGPDANQYRDPTTGAVVKASAAQPIGTFSDHGSPLGLTFGGSALCGEFATAAFILRFGKAAGDFEAGKDLLSISLQKEGAAWKTGTVTQLVRNFIRPIDAVLEGDKLYVIDRGEGTTMGALHEVQLPK